MDDFIIFISILLKDLIEPYESPELVTISQLFSNNNIIGDANNLLYTGITQI